jgi:hypothetical protein
MRVDDVGEDRRAHVVQQVVHRGVRRAGEAQALGGVEPCGRVGGEPEGEQQQPAYAVPVAGGCLLR